MRAQRNCGREGYEGEREREEREQESKGRKGGKGEGGKEGEGEFGEKFDRVKFRKGVSLLRGERGIFLGSRLSSSRRG